MQQYGKPRAKRKADHSKRWGHEVAPQPEGRNLMGSEWTLRIKREPEGATQNYRARVIAQDFTQVEVDVKSPQVDAKSCQRALSTTIYLMLRTRPDLAHAVGARGRKTARKTGLLCPV